MSKRGKRHHARARTGPPGNYVGRVLALAAKEPPRPGEVREVEVLHDDHCRLLRGTGPCDCNPVVRWGRRLSP